MTINPKHYLNRCTFITLDWKWFHVLVCLYDGDGFIQCTSMSSCLKITKFVSKVAKIRVLVCLIVLIQSLVAIYF